MTHKNFRARCCWRDCAAETGTLTWFCDEHSRYRQIETALFDRGVSRGDPDERALTSVYVIGSDRMDAVKIGIAVDVQNRVASLQTGFPFKLQLYGAFYSSRRRAAALERAVHAKLKEFDLHLNGEWFEISPEDARATIKKVAELEGIVAISPWEYYDLIGRNADYVDHEMFSLSDTVRQLLRDNVVEPFCMVDSGRTSA